MDDSRPLSPSSMVAGTDIITPRYNDPRAGADRDHRFYFTERSAVAASVSAEVGGSAAASATATGHQRLSAASLRAHREMHDETMSGGPNLDETAQDDDIDVADDDDYSRVRGRTYTEEGGSSHARSSSSRLEDDQEDAEDKRDNELELEVDVSYDHEGDEVEVMMSSAARGAGEGGGAAAAAEEEVEIDNNSNSRRMTVNDLNLDLAGLSHAATTDAEEFWRQDMDDNDDQKQEHEDDDEEEDQQGHSEDCSLRPEDGEREEQRVIGRERTLLVLRCFAPEGTPLQGREYPLTSSGATLGRKMNNDISFSHRVGTNDLPDGPGATSQSGAYVGIDSSISGEHARVSYDAHDKCLRLYDGAMPATAGSNSRVRGSTNGTWMRLSRMHEPSGWFVLEDGMELLVGAVRFQVEMDEIVVERDIYD